MSAGVTLRPAATADARALAEVHVRSRTYAYADFLDPRSLMERTVETETTRWAGHLAAGETETWLAEVDGRIAGFVTVGAGEDADAAPQTGAVHALYVDPPAQGAGVGSRLLEHAEARLREDGCSEAILWVYAENGLARAFYERHGWTVDPAGPGNERPDWTEPSVRFRLDLR